MTLTVNLTDEMEDRLRRAAQQAGVGEEEFIIRTLKERLLDERRETALEMLQRWKEADAGADAAELEDRKRAWEAFKAGMNENHSSGRKIFP